MTSRQDLLDKGMIHIPGGRKQDWMGSHHTTQNGLQCKIYELFISGVFFFFLASSLGMWDLSFPTRG